MSGARDIEGRKEKEERERERERAVGGRRDRGSSPLGQRCVFWGVDRVALYAEHHRTPTGGTLSVVLCVCL